MSKVKTISIIAAAAMMLAMVGCGNSDNESSKTESSSDVTTESTTEESTEETSEESTETTTTIVEESDCGETDETSESSDASDASAGSSITIPDVDAYFTNLNGKTLDEVKAYIETTFPVGECEESINAYTKNDANGNSVQIDTYTWNFSTEETIDGIAFDYVSVSTANGTLYSAAFNKYDSDEETYSLLNAKIGAYGYETSQGYSDLYTMDCGDVGITLVPDSNTLVISHKYQ